MLQQASSKDMWVQWEECHRVQKRKESLDSIAELSLDQITGCVAHVDPLTQIPHKCMA